LYFEPQSLLVQSVTYANTEKKEIILYV